MQKKSETTESTRVRQLQQFAEASLLLTGEPVSVLQRLLTLIGELFAVRVVCLSEVTGNSLILTTQYVDGKLIQDASGKLSQATPCMSVAQNGELLVCDQPQKAYPRAAYLQDHAAESYCGFPSRDGNGVVVAVTCLLHDAPRDYSDDDKHILQTIGQRIAVELEHRNDMASSPEAESKALTMKLFMEATADSIWNWNMTAGTIQRSVGFQRTFGYSTDEIEPNIEWWINRLHPDDREHILSVFKDAVSEGKTTCSYDYRFRRRDGTYGNVNDRVYIIRDSTGTAVRALGAMTDVTERIRAEASLRESEARLQLAMRAANLGLWDWDLQTNKALFSTEWKRQIGYEDHELERGYVEWESRLHPDDREATLAALAAYKCEDSSIYAVEFRLRHKDGSFRWIHSRGETLSDAEGTPYRMIGCHVDFTELKSAEEQLHHAQKMEGIGQLAGGIAHDFNNILTVILTDVETLLTETGVGSHAKRKLSRVMQAAEHAAELVRQLLTFSRKKVTQIQALDLNKVIGSIRAILESTIGENINLRYDLSNDLPLISADSGMMEQVLINLIVNARDAMPDGGQIRISTAAIDISGVEIQRYPAANEGKYLKLSVQDTGCGMAPEVEEHIFEPFFTTKDVGKGTGLGLAMVYGIAEEHHGWLEVASEVGSGTTITMFIPANPEASPMPEKTTKVPTIADGTETILLVEDKDLLREMTQEVLTDFGYHVIPAASGVEALEIWAVHKDAIDLVFTDMVMPGGVTGADLATQLLAHRPNLKMLYTSGHGAAISNGNIVFEEGVNFLSKPYGALQVSQIVRRTLDADQDAG